MGVVIGIDLGTTNSGVAIYAQGSAEMIPSKTGQVTFPSVVALTDSGRRLVGHLAKRQAITNPDNTIYGTKRLLGQRWGSEAVKRMIDLVPYTCCRGERDDVRIKMGDRVYALAEIAAVLLAELRSMAERHLGIEVRDAVITVPAYFNDAQRQATRDAGRIAGLRVLRIINEPTAAALAFGRKRNLNEKLAVFDLGGGTFDVSILHIGPGVYEVLASAGDTFLGGEDFDERIMHWLVDFFENQHNLDLTTDPMAMQRVRDAAEKAKIELSSRTEVEVNLPFICSPSPGEALHLQTVLNRDTFESMVKDLVERVTGICGEALSRAKIDAGELSEVLLVGGMSRMPLVQRAVESFFGRKPTRGVNPDEVVAKGAAIQGWMLQEAKGESILLDVTAHHLGIMVAGNKTEVLIHRDSAIPCKKSKVFKTTRDNQTKVRIVVLQGDDPVADKNALLGEFILTGLRKAPKGEVRVEVSFQISADGLVGVSAKDVESGKEQTITVAASSGLTEEEIIHMISEHTQQNPEEERRFEAIDERVAIAIRAFESIWPQAQASATQSSFGDDALRKAEQTAESARKAVESRDMASAERLLPALERAVQFLNAVIRAKKETSMSAGDSL